MSDPVDIIGRICNDGEGLELSRIAEALGFDEGYEARIRDKALDDLWEELKKIPAPVSKLEIKSLITALKSQQTAQTDIGPT